MNVESLLDNFENIANAPGGTARIRDLIYHFAFAGQIVSHSNESAANLAEVLALAENPTGRTRRPTPNPSSGYHSIPPHWIWVNIRLIGHDWGQIKPTE